jgi:hypothetical protein
MGGPLRRSPHLINARWRVAVRTFMRAPSCNIKAIPIPGPPLKAVTIGGFGTKGTRQSISSESALRVKRDHGNPHDIERRRTLKKAGSTATVGMPVAASTRTRPAKTKIDQAPAGSSSNNQTLPRLPHCAIWS